MIAKLTFLQAPRFAPDHAGCYTFDAAPAQLERPWTNALHHIGLQRLALAFDNDRRLGLDVKHAAHELIRIVGYETLTTLCRGDQAAGSVDRIPHRSEFTLRTKGT